MSPEKLTFPLSSDDVKGMLQARNVTPTKQRVVIASYLFKKPQHLSADKVLEGVNSEGYKVSRATVYNTLGLFTRIGLVREVLLDRERVFYDSNNTPHHHIFNISNGELQDIENTEIKLTNLPSVGSGMKIVGADVIVRVINEK